MALKYPEVEIHKDRKNSRNYYISISISILLLSIIISCSVSLKSQKKDFESGLELLNKGDYNNAALEFKKFITKHDENPFLEGAYFYAGKSYSMGKNYDKALVYFNSLLENFPFGEYIKKTEYERCVIFFQKGYYNRAIKNLEHLIEQSSLLEMRDKVYILLGKSYFEEKLFNQSLSTFIEAFRFVKDDNEKYLIHLYLAKCYFNLKKSKLMTKELKFLDKIQDENLLCEKLRLELKIIESRKDILEKIDKLIQIKSNCSMDKERGRIETAIKEIIDKISDPSLLDRINEKYSPHFPADYSEFRAIKLAKNSGNILETRLKLQNFQKKHPQSLYLPEINTIEGELSPQTGVSPNKIGCILPLSGNHEIFGSNILLGIKLAIKIFNEVNPESNIKLIVKDDKGQPEITKQCLQDFALKDGVIAVIGPVLSINAASVLEAADAYQIPVISPAASSSDIVGKSKFFMRNCITLSQQLTQLIDFAQRKLQLHSFALIYPENKYGYTVSKLFGNIMNNSKKTNSCQFSYPQNTTDFKNQIITLSHAAKPPVAIILPDSANVVSMIASQIAFYGLTNYQLLGTNNWNSPDIFKSGKQFVQGGIFCDNFYKDELRPAIQYFYSRFVQEYSKDPDYLQAQAYDTAIMIMQRIKNGTKSRTVMNEQLHNIKNFQGVSGITSILENGEAEKHVSFFKIEKDAFVKI
ncbi:ABC transporter substrate-binding protein, partial [bacterium]|nr:ABC transporter substrate-binding protein [bacterium]